MEAFSDWLDSIKDQPDVAAMLKDSENIRILKHIHRIYYGNTCRWIKFVDDNGYLRTIERTYIVEIEKMYNEILK